MNNFEKIREQVEIMEVAWNLLRPGKRPDVFFYPGEKTPSIKIYPRTGSFYDFGRGCGGDVVRLWSHINKCDDWTAAQETAACFGVDLDADDKITADDIKVRQRARLDAQKVKKQAAANWRKEVDWLKSREESYQGLLDSGHLKPFSEPWCWCKNGLQMVEYRLDLLCGIEK